MTEYRVYGPPGTGKTTWIARKAAEYAGMFGSDQVSICSMTRSAVREVAGRDLPIPDDNISTLHARCRRALMAGKPAESMVRDFARDHPSYATSECLPVGLMRSIGNNVPDDSTSDEVLLSGGGVTLYEHAQILRQQMIPRDRWSPRVVAWFDVWSSWCASHGAMDFTGWLEACRGTNVLPPQQVVFVDEAQDHTPLQLAVLRSWPAQHLIMVGDDDQNLYEWSGAVPAAFLSPALPAEQERVLAESHRVPRAVHALATRWISGVQGRREKSYAPKAGAEGEVIRSDFALYDADAGQVPDLIGEPGRTSMILASCAYMLNGVISALKREGIPFWNPYRRLDAHWNPLDRTLHIARGLVVGDRGWTGEEVSRWASILAEKKAFERGGKRRLIQACEEAGGRPLPLTALSESLNGEAYDLVSSQDVAILDSMRMTGATGDWPYTLRVIRSHGAGVRPSVIVGTIHSVKGGEADDVVVFPDLSPAGYAEYMSRSERDRILRLYYVAMTRTRDRLVLCEQSSPRAVSWD
jgi:DNA helicase-2/ATP-dependent DNA helicase PcrA